MPLVKEGFLRSGSASTRLFPLEAEVPQVVQLAPSLCPPSLGSLTESCSSSQTSDSQREFGWMLFLLLYFLGSEL